MKFVISTEADPEARRIMVRAEDEHIITPHDSIDQPCASHYGKVMAPSLAVNIPGAVGCLARDYNRNGNQVWKQQWMKERAWT